jgi:hypothetical protein
MKKTYIAPTCKIIVVSMEHMMAGSIKTKTEFGTSDYDDWYHKPTDVVNGNDDDEPNKSKGNIFGGSEE